jgi:hypothetical protein
MLGELRHHAPMAKLIAKKSSTYDGPRSDRLAVTREPPRLTPARRAEQEARDRRLAAALRANLQRRKDQARTRENERPEPAREPERR